MCDHHLLPDLFQSNQRWAQRIKDQDPEFFAKLAQQQSPEYLWIGCADSRVPANEIVDLLPGELFVHRNVANVVSHNDFNCHSVIQYAVEVLKVKHIMVVGHYGCGGVRAALEDASHGLIDNWLRNIKDVYFKHEQHFRQLSSQDERVDLLCELNVMEQMINVCHTTIVQNAWRAGQELHVHGWIYDIQDGILKDLGLCVSALDQIPSYHAPLPAQLGCR
ncbi:carbonate dehydratase [Balneatrix alpica]|uniref:Carbonic anhydrase n=1 Tax=Balneatrix alpica TaxID=75684 RepID=A0ABV5Z6J1_9GAMM|nr:carbonate dehydratase [Balneatrix alpica]